MGHPPALPRAVVNCPNCGKAYPWARAVVWLLDTGEWSYSPVVHYRPGDIVHACMWSGPLVIEGEPVPRLPALP